MILAYPHSTDLRNTIEQIACLDNDRTRLGIKMADRIFSPGGYSISYNECHSRSFKISKMTLKGNIVKRT